MSKNKRIKFNFYYKLIYQIVAILVPLITTPYLARVLGAIELGNYGYTYSIMIYFGLFAVFGFNIYGRREMAKVRDDKKLASKTFYEIFLARSIPTIISIIGFVFLAIFYKEYSILFFALIPHLFYHLFDLTFVIQGDENFKYVTFRELGVKITSIVLIFLFIKKPSDVWIYALIISSTTLVSAFAMAPYLKKRFVKVPFKSLVVLPHLKRSAVFLIPAFATSVFLFIDKIMIKLISGSSEQVAFYEESIKIVTMLTGITTALANVIEPRNAHEIAEGHIDVAKDNTIKGINYSMFICFPMAIGLFAVCGIFCPIFFGDGFEDVVPILRIMCILIPITSLNELLGTTYVIATNREKAYSSIILICAFLNIALNFLFIYLFSALGAAIGTVISEVVKSMILILYLRKELRFSIVAKNMMKKVISCLAIAAFAIPMAVLANGSILSLVIITIVGILIFIAFEMILKDKEFEIMYSTVIDRFKKLFRIKTKKDK